MDKKHILLGVLSIAIVSGGVFYFKKLRASVATYTNSGKIRVPRYGSNYQYKLSELFELINVNNPSNNSNFLVKMRDGNPVSGSSTNVDGSAGAHVIERAHTWFANNSTRVTLQKDQNLIDKLISQGRLDSDDEKAYKNILLYFELTVGSNTYRLYLNDPCPGGISGNVYPSKDIWEKWALDGSGTRIDPLYRPQ